MKNTIIILFLFFTGLCLAQEAREQPVEADFRGRDCGGGIGICSFEPSNSANANAFLYKNADGSLTLKILRAKLSAGEETHIFGQAINLVNKESLSFQQPESFQLANDLKSELEIASPLDEIKAGTYPAEITKETISIRFSLQ